MRMKGRGWPPKPAILTRFARAPRQNRKIAPTANRLIGGENWTKFSMAKKKQSASETNKALATVEQNLVKQLQKYAELVTKLASSNPDDALKILSTAAEREKLAQLIKQRPGSLDTQCLGAIFRELASGTRAAVQPTRVGFLGPLHSYSHLAALRRFGQSAELVAVRTIAAVFEEVSTKQVDAGLVPIENSTDGRIVDTLDMFTKSPVKICGEVPLRIHHNLLGSGTRANINEVCSKPQALSQCREWLANHLPKAKLHAMSSTTAAAESAAKNPRIAAVASRQAGIEYGLKVLARNIEDNKDNITRFAVIGLDVAKKTGADKTSLMFELRHEPGALADAMVIFKRNRLNLTWIESFPKPGSPNEYLFFVELMGYLSDLRVRRALDSLRKKTVRLEILGSYAIATAD